MENQKYKSYEQAALEILRGNHSQEQEEKPVQENQETQQPLSEEVHPDSLHVKPVKVNGQTKYKVHAVGANHSDGIKVGEHLSDSELDDFSEMGGKIKHMKEEAEELDEMGPGKLPRIDKKVENEYGEKLMADFKARGGEVKQVKSPALPKNRNRMVARGSLSSGERTVTKSGGKSYTARMEEVEQIDEVTRNDPLLQKVGPIRTRDNTTGRISPKDQKLGKERVKDQIKTSIQRMKSDKKPNLPEEVVEEDYDQLIEEKNSFEIDLPEQLIFADYLNAAKLFTESYDDAIVVADSFFRNNDESLVIEAFTRSDIEDRVKMHQKAGNQTTMPKYGMKDNKPYAEYTVTEKESGKKTKYIHHGNMRRVERMN